MTPIQNLLVAALVLTLVFVIVSLSFTYNLTIKAFGGLVGQKDQASYGTGLTFSNRGFLLHVLVFFLIVFGVSFYVNKKRGSV